MFQSVIIVIMAKDKKNSISLFTPFAFDKFTDNEKISSSTKREYLRQMLILAQDDKKAVVPYIAIAIGTIVFLTNNRFDDLLSKSNLALKLMFYAGILLLMISAVLFFTYWRKIHKCRIQITSCIPNLNIVKARDYWMDLWDKNERLFKLALIFLVTGAFLVYPIVFGLKLIA